MRRFIGSRALLLCAMAMFAVVLMEVPASAKPCPVGCTMAKKAAIQAARVTKLACRLDCRQNVALSDRGACLRGCADGFRATQGSVQSDKADCLASCAPLATTASSRPASRPDSCRTTCGQDLTTCTQDVVNAAKACVTGCRTASDRITCLLSCATTAEGDTATCTDDFKACTRGCAGPTPPGPTAPAPTPGPVPVPGDDAPMTPVFGPKQYIRHTGAPQTVHETFQHCGTQECRIVVVNGTTGGSNRISSASIYLNGVPVIGPSDFNQQVSSIVKPVALGDTNQLTITLASKPGSFITVDVECATSPVILSLGGAGVSLLNPNTLLSAVPIINTGTAAAQSVQLTAITLGGGALLTTPTLPFDVGTIPAGSSLVLDADFSGAFTPLASYVLGVEGTYAVGDATYCFSLDGSLVVPPAAPGSGTLGTVDVGPNTVSGAPYPPETPEFDDDVNTHLWTVPTAPFEPGGPPPGSTDITPAPFGDPPAIVFNANSGLGFTSGLISPAEPSGATGGGVVFVSANLRAAYSTNGGATFTSLNPTSIFPADTVGFCCDQIVQYVPSIDRFVWLLQGKKTGGYRLAVARPADIISSGGTAWTYWNLTPQVFGEPAGTSVDYPDLSVGNNSLYMSWDGNGGLQVVRTSLAGLQAGGTITLEFTHPKDAPMAWGAHLMQDTGDEVFWAGHNSNKNMRVFSLQEGLNTYFWRDIGIASWANNSPLTSNTPDNQNWIDFLMNPTTQNPGGGFPLNAVLGATRVGDQLWFAWSAGTDSNFAQPHIEMVTLDRSNNFSKIQQVQVWNASYAFAYPALATNGCTGEVGMSFEFGGGGNYENHVVGFWGDFVAYVTTGSDVGSIRFGDYVSIRQAPPTASDPGNLFAAFGYGINNAPPPGSGTVADVHYVLFGRPSSACEIIR